MILTKSKYLIGIQCPKYLWISYHEKEKLPKPDASTEEKFRQGNEIGELAKKLFPNGIDLDKTTKNLKENLEKVPELLKKRVPLFEPSFSKDNLFSKADVLKPANKDEWDIIEVKSGTKVKDINLHDLSFQKYCYENCGLKIRKTILMHVNNQFVKKGDIDVNEFFILEDVTEKVNDLMEDVEDKIFEMLKVIRSKESPKVLIGPQCSDPYGCPISECWDFVKDGSVLELYNIRKKKAFKLIEDGYELMDDLPEDFKLNDKQSIQRECARSGKVHVHKEALKHFLKTLKEPLYYMDFETINPAIPLFDGMKPYQRIPFQFSVHVVNNGDVVHHEFLASGKEDFREKFLVELKKVLGVEGGIVVYNQAFEKGVLRELGESFPEYDGWVKNVDGRIIDLLVPFRSFYYYNPLQKGSASIKKVLPAVVGKGYKDLGISSGGDASAKFFRVNFLGEGDQEKVCEELLEYCGLDTEAMVWIVEELRKIV